MFFIKKMYINEDSMMENSLLESLENLQESWNLIESSGIFWNLLEFFRILESSGTSREKVTILHCNTEYPTPM